VRIPQQLAGMGPMIAGPIALARLMQCLRVEERRTMKITRESSDSRLLKWSGFAVCLFIVGAFASAAHVASASGSPGDAVTTPDTAAWLVPPVPVRASAHHRHHHRGG
jgi:hypothetical protein